MGRGIACQDWLTVRLVSAMRHQQCLPLPSGPHCPARCVENHVPFICVPHRVRAAISPQLIISRRGAETTQRWPPSPAPTNTTGEAGSQRAVCGGSSNSSGLVQLQRVARAVPRRPGPRCTASTRCSRPPRGSSCRSPASWCSWPQPAPARAPRSARSAGRPASAHPRCLAAGSPVRLNLSGQEPRRHAGKSQSKPPPTSTAAAIAPVSPGQAPCTATPQLLSLRWHTRRAAAGSVQPAAPMARACDATQLSQLSRLALPPSEVAQALYTAALQTQ
jgi:hypothetical protein